MGYVTASYMEIFEAVLVCFCFVVSRELDDELQDSLFTYLEERGIDEQLAIFLHEYMRDKEKTEFIGWMQSVKSYIEKK